MRGSRTGWFHLAVCGVLWWAAGCGSADVEDYVPAEKTARQALSTVLEAWKSGQPYSDQVGADPAIHVLDSRWQEGQKLTAYEILGTAPGDDQNQRFKVRLAFNGQEQEVVYVVVGQEPLWVFSQADYQRASGI